MKIHLSDILYLIRHDFYFRNRLKKILLVGCFGLIIISGLLIVGGYFLFTPIVGLILSILPGATEFIFNNARGILSSFMLDDLLNLLSPLGNNANAVEMKGLITKYFDQLKIGSGIDFQSFQNFISTVKNAVSDGNVSAADLDMIKRLLPN
jgi:hypothetical protein